MLRLHRGLCPWLLGGLLWLAACSGTPHTEVRNALPLAPEGALAGWPAPSELLRQSSSGPVDLDRCLAGDAYDHQLPSANIDAGGPKGALAAPPVGNGELQFQPQYSDPASSALADCAYAMYLFDSFTGYSGLAQVQTVWSSAPPDYSHVFIGLAHWDSDSWNWFNLPAADVLSTASLEPYLNPAGEALLIVLLTGSAEANLKYLILGGNTFVNAVLKSDLDADPALNLAPLTVNWDATSSNVRGGTIVKYNWDFNADGSYEIEDDVTGLAQHTYPAGLQSTVVQVIDEEGGADAQLLQFTAVDPANTPPQVTLEADTLQGDAPLVVTLTAQVVDDGSIQLYEWDVDGLQGFDYETAVPQFTYIVGQYGQRNVGVRVTDNDYATDLNGLDLDVQTGWRYSTVASGTQLVDPPSVSVYGSGASARACVAWRNSTGDDLCYSHATNMLGSAWAAPVNPVPTADDTGYSPTLALSPLTAFPVIAFGRFSGSTYSLYYVKASVQDGASWAAPILVDGASDSGLDNSLALISGRPCIASLSNSSTHNEREVVYYRAGDGSGQDWNGPFSAFNNPGVDYLNSVGLVGAGGLALIACNRSLSGTGTEALLLHATAADGSAWAAPIVYEDIDCRRFGLGIAAGNPLLATGSSAQGGQLYFARGTTADGSTWPASLTELAGPGLGGEPSLSFVGGNPALVWAGFDGGHIWYQRASNAQGTAWGPAHRVASSIGYQAQPSLAVVGGNPVVVYYDGDAATLRAAWWQP